MNPRRSLLFLSSPELWQRGHGPSHPLKPSRLQRTHQLLDAYGVFEQAGISLAAPRVATARELSLFHTSQYVDAVRELSEGRGRVAASRYNFGPGDNPVFPGMYESEGRKVGSALQAAEAILAGRQRTAFSYSGGLHHGGPDFASGFCVFNDVAVAIHWLLKREQRIAYVDVDVHHGDGVQNAFYETDRVLTISIHQDPRTLFPGTGRVEETGRAAGLGHAVNLPLPPGTDDYLYLSAFDEIVPLLIERFDPDILVSQLGVDTHHLDPLAQLALTTKGQRAVFERLRDLNRPWLALGGGGYNLDVVPRSWALAVEVMTGSRLPGELPSAYRGRFGGRWLRDEDAGIVPAKPPTDLAKRVARTLSDLKALHAL